MACPRQAIAMPWEAWRTAHSIRLENTLSDRARVDERRRKARMIGAGDPLHLVECGADGRFRGFELVQTGSQGRFRLLLLDSVHNLRKPCPRLDMKLIGGPEIFGRAA